MKKISILAAILSLGIAAFSAPAFSEQQSQYKTKFEVPDYINLSISDIIPVKIKITSPDGKPYNGKVTITSAGCAQLSGAKTAQDCVDVDVVAGAVTINADMQCHSAKTLFIVVYKSPESLREPIGVLDTPVHHVDSYDFLPEQSILAVPTDGKTSPTLSIRIKDEAGNPVKGVRVGASHGVQLTTAPSPQTYIYANTDATGVARFVYPPSTIRQYESTQAIVPAQNGNGVIFAASTLTLKYYGNEKPKMISLKKSVESIPGATYTWDSKTRTATVKGVSVYPKDPLIFKAGSQCVIAGSSIYGLEAPIQLKGDTLMVPQYWTH